MYYTMSPALWGGVSGGGGGALLLDGLINVPKAAWGYRKLRTAYAGSCCQVQRSSDNTTLDIGFLSGLVDTSAISTFCAGANGATSRWYDQSGNGNDLIQATAALQPTIFYSGTTIVVQNGKTCSGYNAPASNNHLDVALTGMGQATLQLVVTGSSFDTGGGYHAGVSYHGSTDGNAGDDSSALSAGLFGQYAAAIYTFRSSLSGTTTSAISANPTPFVASTVYDGTNGSFFVNGSANGSGAYTGVFDATGTLRFGTDGTGSNGWSGTFAEAILWTVANSTDRAACESSAKTFWGTP